MPAAAVKRRVQALSGFTGRKECRRWFDASDFKDPGSTGEKGRIRSDLSAFGEAGIDGGGVKSVDIVKNTEGEGKPLGRC